MTSGFPKSERTLDVDSLKFKSSSRSSAKAQVKGGEPRELWSLGSLLSLDNPDKAYSILLKQKPYMSKSDFDDCQQNVLIDWAERDPEQVLSLLDSIDSAEAKGYVIAGLVNGWAGKDVLKGFEFLDSAEMDSVSPEIFNECHSILIQSFAQDDPRQAAEMFRKYDDRDFKSGIISSITRSYAELDYKDALDWAGSLDSLYLRDLAVLNILNAFDSTKKETLLSFIEKQKTTISPKVVADATSLIESREYFDE